MAWGERWGVAPLSLIVSAFAPVEDARRTLTPQLRTDCGDTELILVDLGGGRNRVPGAHAAARVSGLFRAVQAVAQAGRLLAYHDRSDGGLFAAVCEMAFAGRCGVTLNLDALVFDAAADDVDAFKRDS